MVVAFTLVLLGAFMRDVQAAQFLATGGHPVEIPAFLPVTRPVTEPLVEADVATPSAAPAAGAPGSELPLWVPHTVGDEADAARAIIEEVAATPAPAPESVAEPPPQPVAEPEPAPESVAEPEPVEAGPPAPAEGLGAYLGSFKVTCYALQGITFSGAPVALDGVAVDPAVIPIGASMYIDGLGWKVARDTGGLIIDKTIDIWNPSRDWCIQWGVQYLDVWGAPA